MELRKHHGKRVAPEVTGFDFASTNLKTQGVATEFKKWFYGYHLGRWDLENQPPKGRGLF